MPRYEQTASGKQELGGTELYDALPATPEELREQFPQYQLPAIYAWLNSLVKAGYARTERAAEGGSDVMNVESDMADYMFPGNKRRGL